MSLITSDNEIRPGQLKQSHQQMEVRGEGMKIIKICVSVQDALTVIIEVINAENQGKVY